MQKVILLFILCYRRGNSLWEVRSLPTDVELTSSRGLTQAVWLEPSVPTTGRHISQLWSVLFGDMLHTALSELNSLTDSSTDFRKGQWGEKRKRDRQEKDLGDRERHGRGKKVRVLTRLSSQRVGIQGSLMVSVPKYSFKNYLGRRWIVESRDLWMRQEAEVA